MNRMQWVFRRGCGCPFGVLEGVQCPDRGGPRLLTQSQAWKNFYETARERDAATDRGVTAELMTHDEYAANVLPQMLSDYRCPHTSTTAVVSCRGVMKAITIRQPYARCVAIGRKLVENRGRATAYRGPIAIHAAKRPDMAGDHDPRVAFLYGPEPRLGAPLGAVVAVANLIGCHRASPAESACCQPWGDVEYMGNPAWHLVFADDVQMLNTPVPAVGKLMVPWELPADVAAEVERQITTVAS